MKLDAETARKIVAALETDIRDRRGLKWEWARIDEDVPQEIREIWVKLIQEAVSDPWAEEGSAVASGPGPATKMYEAHLWIQGEKPSWPESLIDCKVAADEATENIIPATLEAMDAAADPEIWTPSRRVQVREMAREEADGLVIGLAAFDEREERELLRLLLERAVQRRKEQGDG